MSRTATSTVGYGVRVTPEHVAANPWEFQFVCEFLDTEKYPNLTTALSGWAPHEEMWVFTKSSVSKNYDGLSGNGCHTSIPAMPLTVTSEVEELNRWIEEQGLDSKPGYFLIHYVN